jgi:hypothetical protein
VAPANQGILFCAAVVTQTRPENAFLCQWSSSAKGVLRFAQDDRLMK